MKTALVLGAGGFIGHHLVNRLKAEGYWVRGVDLKYPEFETSKADEFLIYDLRDPRHVEAVIRYQVSENFAVGKFYTGFTFLPNPLSNKVPFDEVYQLAADMGGAGYIFTGEHDSDVMHNSAMINLNVAYYAAYFGVKKLFYSSSACMYPQERQNKEVYGFYEDGLKESDAYPANPDSEYGWEKLFSERLYLAYLRNHGLNVRIARFHNIYGPMGTYKGGKEKAPAAICRKVAQTSDHCNRGSRGIDTIEIWGDGEQTRSFLYIDDCIDAVRLLMESDFNGPINIGSEEMVSINQLAEMTINISGKSIRIKHIDGPTGVRGRNSNNNLVREKLAWEPKHSLREGLEKTYNWIKTQVHGN